MNQVHNINVLQEHPHTHKTVYVYYKIKLNFTGKQQKLFCWFILLENRMNRKETNDGHDNSAGETTIWGT